MGYYYYYISFIYSGTTSLFFIKLQTKKIMSDIEEDVDYIFEQYEGFILVYIFIIF